MSEEQSMVQKCFAEIGKRFDGIEQTLKREKEVAYKYIKGGITGIQTTDKFKFSEDLSSVIEVKRSYFSGSGEIEGYEIYENHPYDIIKNKQTIYIRNDGINVISINKNTLEITCLTKPESGPPLSPDIKFRFASWITKEEYERNTYP